MSTRSKIQLYIPLDAALKVDIKRRKKNENITHHHSFIFIILKYSVKCTTVYNNIKIASNYFAQQIKIIYIINK